MTTPVPKVYAAIQRVQELFSASGLAKDRDNKTQGFKFRGIDDVYNSLSTYLVEAKLLIVPRVTSTSARELISKNGGTLVYTNVIVEYDFISSEDGSKVTACMVGEAMDSGDKSSNKAMSAAYKYLCLQSFCIPTEGDNDADATTHELAPANQQQAAAQPKRDLGPKLTIAKHTKAMQDAQTIDELRHAFALAWKQYENPKDPADRTPTQLTFKATYEACLDILDPPQAETDEADAEPTDEPVPEQVRNEVREETRRRLRGEA